MQIEKVYLVEQRAPAEEVHFRLNLDQVWVLDRNSKRMERAPVLWNEHITDDTDHTKLILRIRCTWPLSVNCSSGCQSKITCASWLDRTITAQERWPVHGHP